MEMLIVIAIVAVLISVAVPVPSSQLERSREAVDPVSYTHLTLPTTSRV